MKKLTWIFAGLITVSLLYSFLNTQAKENQTSTDYIIIRYNPYIGAGRVVRVHRGAGKVEVIEFTKDQMKDDNFPTSQIVDLLNKFSSEGYELVSTAPDQGLLINCYLRKVK